MDLQRQPAMKSPPLFNAKGFSLVEMIMITGIISVMMVSVTMIMPSFVKEARADASAALTLNALRIARDRAIGDRRNIAVIFTQPKHIEVIRRGIFGEADETIEELDLEGNQKFLHFDETEDTLDDFGLINEPVAFGPTQGDIPPLMFTSEGTFTDATGDPINGTLFLGTPGELESARAITIFGATALLHLWRWDGKQWAE
jgi:Tfp pilus assembly protein FimT